MASKQTRRQIAICAIAEGYAQMMADQGAGDDPQFMGIRQGIESVFLRCMAILETEPGAHRLNKREVQSLKTALDRLHDEKYGQCVDSNSAISMIICMIIDQIARIKNERKRAAFESLLNDVENLMTWSDPEWTYEGREGYDAAILFERLEV